MDATKVGKAIAYLRKQSGYTQRELAERIGVSDKAVSKWERGIGFPDTSLIGKLAILLDTTADALLEGETLQHNEWDGVLILPENEEGIYSGTLAHDKPLVQFQLCYFMLLGIRNIHVICGDRDREYLQLEYGDGSELGIRLSYSTGFAEASCRTEAKSVMIVFGYSIIYGVDQTRFFQKAMTHNGRITVLSVPKHENGSELRVYFNTEKKVVSTLDAECVRTQYAYHQIPILFCPKEKLLDVLGGITLQQIRVPSIFIGQDLHTEVLDRGFVEIRVNDFDDVGDASLFVRIVQNACGMQIYCIEEIAWRRGLISREQFKLLGEKKKNSVCGKYILKVADDTDKQDKISNS